MTPGEKTGCIYSTLKHHWILFLQQLIGRVNYQEYRVIIQFHGVVKGGGWDHDFEGDEKKQ